MREEKERDNERGRVWLSTLVFGWGSVGLWGPRMMGVVNGDGDKALSLLKSEQAVELLTGLRSARCVGAVSLSGLSGESSRLWVYVS